MMTTRQTFRSAHARDRARLHVAASGHKTFAPTDRSIVQMSKFWLKLYVFSLVRDSVDLASSPTDYCPDVRTIDAGGENNVPM